MKKKNIITSLAIALAFLPFYTSAESVETASVSISSQPATEAQVFTSCSQASIEIRDTAIGVARTIYNTAMSAALSARKDSEKKAVALDDPSDKKDAIRTTVENYRDIVTGAQENLTEARKEIWNSFEENTNNCRDISKETRKGVTSEKKATTVEKKAVTVEKKLELKTLQTVEKTTIDDSKKEVKTLRESFFDQLDSIRNFFKKGAQDSK